MFCLSHSFIFTHVLPSSPPSPFSTDFPSQPGSLVSISVSRPRSQLAVCRVTQAKPLLRWFEDQRRSILIYFGNIPVGQAKIVFPLHTHRNLRISRYKWQTIMDNKHDPACLPKEILDITWSNTSEERLKEAYKVWADTYDKVRNTIYSLSVVVYSSCMPMSSR